MFNKEEMIMKSIKGLLFILLVLTCVFFAGQAAFALVGSETGDTPIITVHPKAKGIIYKGPLTIYYTNIILDPNTYVQTADITFFMRLQDENKKLHAFSGQAIGVDYYDFSAQQAIIEAFIHETVIPILYPNSNQKPNFLLKAVHKIVADDGKDVTDPSGCCNGMTFTIMNVVIAVQCK
jgi:hypothetical protein